MKPVLALDQGTTSSRTLLFDGSFNPIAKAQLEFTQHFPKPGYVEHDAEEIWNTQLLTMQRVIDATQISTRDLSALGITNQRETLVGWDKSSGKPLYHALVWQDRRTHNICLAMKKRGLEAGIRKKTGLLLDPYFSATKMQWLLKHVPQIKAAAKANRLCFGTIDSWLIFNLTAGKRFVTDVSNASRTLLFNLRTLSWDTALLNLFGVPRSALAEILPCDGNFGYVEHPALPTLKGLRISGVAGDQQAALFGQGCMKPGMTKNTYGTGCFMLRNLGDTYVAPPKGLLATVAWSLSGKVTYAHEGAVLVGGAAIQFLRDQLGLLNQASDSEALAKSVHSNDGVYFVPAFAGLGTPHWDAEARGLIIGLTRGTTRAHLVRAALEAIAFQTQELYQSFPEIKTSGIKTPLVALKVDGGATANHFLMQFQADLLGLPIFVSEDAEVTARGAAFLAALGAKVITLKQLSQLKLPGRIFKPKMPKKKREQLCREWAEAALRSRGWAAKVG